MKGDKKGGGSEHKVNDVESDRGYEVIGAEDPENSTARMPSKTYVDGRIQAACCNQLGRVETG